MRITPIVAIIAILALAAPADAVFRLEAPLPVGVRMGSGSGGEISFSTYETNDNILYGGVTTSGTTSAWSFWVDGQHFVSQSSAPNPEPHFAIDDGNGTQTWTINGVAYTLNSTLVHNSTLLVMTAANIDSVAHDVAFRYQWDTYNAASTDGDPDGPEFHVPGEPGDEPGFPECYKKIEQDWAFPQFQYIKNWQTCAGPDAHGDTKGYLVWDSSMGGTTPDRFTIASWGKAVSAANSWHFATGEGSIDVDRDNAIISWWGYYDPYHLLPGEEETFVFWYGVGMPPPLAEFFVNLYFTDRPNAGPAETAEDLLADSTRQRFIEAGQTTYYPFSVTNDGGIIGGNPEEQEPTEFDLTVAGEAPPGWVYEVIEGNAPVPVEDLALKPQESRDLRLRVTAPLGCGDEEADANACAMGSDAAIVNVTVEYSEKPSGFFNPEKSRLSHTLFTTTTVKPVFDVELSTTDGPQSIHPGESAEYELLLRNTGNIRDKVPFDLSMVSIMNPGWSAEFEPKRVALSSGETADVTLKLTVPSNEPGGEHVLTARAGVSGKTDFDTEEVSLTVLADRAIFITTPEPQKTVPPGGSTIFPISVTNNGAQGVPLELALTMEQPSIEAGWTASLKHPGFPAILNPGRTASATVTLTAPADAEAGQRSSLLFAAVDAAAGGQVLSDIGLAGVAGAEPETALDGMAGVPTVSPGSTFVMEIHAENLGNRDDALRLLPSSLPANWRATVSPATLNLAPGQTGSYQVTVTAADDAFAGATDIAFRVVDRDSVTQQSIVRTVNVAVIREAVMEAEDLVLRTLPLESVELNVLLKNTGNAADSMTLGGLPDGFTVDSSPAQPWTVDPGQSKWIRLRITAPDVIESFTIPLTAISEDGDRFLPGPKGTLDLHVSRPDLAVQNMEVNGGREDPIYTDDLVTIQAKVINTGEVGAQNFNVRLYVDGEPTDNVYAIELLEAASDAGRTSVALVPLTWVANEPGEHVLSVVVDDELAVKESRRDNNEQQVGATVLESQGGGQPLDSLEIPENLRQAPGPAIPLLVLIGAIVAVLRRR